MEKSKVGNGRAGIGGKWGGQGVWCERLAAQKQLERGGGGRRGHVLERRRSIGDQSLPRAHRVNVRCVRINQTSSITPFHRDRRSNLTRDKINETTDQPTIVRNQKYKKIKRKIEQREFI